MEAHPDIIEMRSRHERAERATTTVGAQAVEALALLTGTYLAISPWVVGFNNLTTLTVNNLIVGIAYALIMSGGFGRAYEWTHSKAWAGCALAVWTVISQWVISGNVDTTKTVVNNVLVGVIALVLGIAASIVAALGARRLRGQRAAPYQGGAGS
ncbi:SPW repeat protein [Streptomyces sp. S.PNR 29]|uniref:SPW repeat protein n=1 Tax=Streptomyces sp. S.PNR 29 TaxID=2973805 RepID=UPI0025B0B91C|nr:SPW repeat protein [Streptomyces sp. S.PNR 29]MDN0198691.1 SPW repeat protein [Streptomyces sp. S.PNR 29]